MSYSDVHWHYFCPVPADRGAGIQQQPLKDAYGAKSPRLSDGKQCAAGQIREKNPEAFLLERDTV